MSAADPLTHLTIALDDLPPALFAALFVRGRFTEVGRAADLTSHDMSRYN